MRDSVQSPSKRIAAPALAVSLAVMLPMVIAAETGGAMSARPVVLVGQDRADVIARCVSEAARKFWPSICVAPAAVDMRRHVGHAQSLLRFVSDSQDDAAAPTLAHLPSLIDLPPPLR